MNTVILDTSALAAHFLGEPGADTVQRLLTDASKRVTICSVTLFEFRYVLKARGLSAGDAEEVMTTYSAIFDDAVAVDVAVIREAVRIREGAGGRLPAMDAMIAAGAVCNNATLVHCDSHFDGIRPSVMKQIRLPEAYDATSADVPPVVREGGATYKVGRKGKRGKRA